METIPLRCDKTKRPKCPKGYVHFYDGLVDLWGYIDNGTVKHVILAGNDLFVPEWLETLSWFAIEHGQSGGKSYLAVVRKVEKSVTLQKRVNLWQAQVENCTWDQERALLREGWKDIKKACKVK